MLLTTTPVSAFVIATFAAGTIAPLGSVTLPRIVPLGSWAEILWPTPMIKAARLSNLSIRDI
jgi:hypothetical protein